MSVKSANHTVHFRWWVKPYLMAHALSAKLLGRDPDPEAVWARVGHGVKVKPSQPAQELEREAA